MQDHIGVILRGLSAPPAIARLRRLASPALLALSLAPAACSKMSPEECTKLRDQAFELINTANMCSADAECKPSEWPGCAKPVNAQNFDKMRAMSETFKKGKCEEKPAQCKPTPPVYCQEGICAFRYKPYQAPGEGMKIE